MRSTSAASRHRAGRSLTTARCGSSALGRMTPWKGYTTMLAGLELATEQGLDAELEIRGPALTSAEQEHLAELRRIVSASSALRERVRARASRLS